MPNKDVVVLSESEFDGETVEQALKGSIRDIQAGLCQVEDHLMKMISKDYVDATSWIASHECNIELKNLVLELIMICKEIKPSSKALKIARGEIDEAISDFKKSGENL